MSDIAVPAGETRSVEVAGDMGGHGPSLALGRDCVVVALAAAW
ncbi:MAG: hypothetical protein ACLSVD_12610 [Eggerthellaceae bacterium]